VMNTMGGDGVTTTQRLEQALIEMYIPPACVRADGSVVLYLYTVGYPMPIAIVPHAKQPPLLSPHG